MLDDIKLRNKTLMALTSYAVHDKHQPGADLVTHYWDRTTSNSPLGRWSVDAVIMKINRKQFEEDIAKYPAEFVQLVAVRLMQQTSLVDNKAFQAKLREHIEMEDSA
jgi:hypothetical protein